MNPIEIHDLTKRYGDTTAVGSLDLIVNEGEVYGFLGPNGAGKSTTINVLMDFIRPSSGEVQLFGLDPTDDVIAVHQRVGILPERFEVFERLTGREHLEYVINSKDVDGDPGRLLDRVGLGDAMDKRADEYSRGMQQRLALSMALVGSPDLLILDEPFTGLDPHGVQKVREIVYEENDRGSTVFFSSHVLGQVEFVCDRIGILNRGTLVAEGEIDTLRQSADVSFELVISLDRNPENLPRILSCDRIKDLKIDGEEIIVDIDSRGDYFPVLNRLSEFSEVQEFTVKEPSVEDIFLAHTDPK